MNVTLEFGPSTTCWSPAGCLGRHALHLHSSNSFLEPMCALPALEVESWAEGFKSHAALMQQISDRLGNRAGFLISICCVCRSARMLIARRYQRLREGLCCFAINSLFLFFFFPVTQSLDLLTKTRTLYFKTSSASCTTGRNKNINGVNLSLICQNPVF